MYIHAFTKMKNLYQDLIQHNY